MWSAIMVFGSLVEVQHFFLSNSNQNVTPQTLVFFSITPVAYLFESSDRKIQCIVQPPAWGQDWLTQHMPAEDEDTGPARFFKTFGFDLLPVHNK